MTANLSTPTPLSTSRATPALSDGRIRAAGLVVSVLTLGLLWSALAAWAVADGVLPGSIDVLSALWELLTDGYRGKTFVGHLAPTLGRLLLGWGGGLVLGSLLGLAIGTTRATRLFFDPLVTFLPFLTPLILGGVLVSLTGISTTSSTFLAVGFVPFWLAVDAVARFRTKAESGRGIDAVLIRLRISLVVAVVALFQFERFVHVGLGSVYWSARNFSRFDMVISSVLVVAVIAAVFDYLIRLATQLYRQRSTADV